MTERRGQLPWVPVEKEYEFDTEDGKKALAELFDGRSQLLAYNIMFGPDYEVGACPGCSNLGDELDATRMHLNHRDATLICFSRAPIDLLVAYSSASVRGRFRARTPPRRRRVAESRPLRRVALRSCA